MSDDFRFKGFDPEGDWPEIRLPLPLVTAACWPEPIWEQFIKPHLPCDQDMACEWIKNTSRWLNCELHPALEDIRKAVVNLERKVYFNIDAAPVLVDSSGGPGDKGSAPPPPKYPPD